MPRHLRAKAGARSVPRNGTEAPCFYVCFRLPCQPAMAIKSIASGNSLLRMLHDHSGHSVFGNIKAGFL
jgi:hypothetical protein